MLDNLSVATHSYTLFIDVSTHYLVTLTMTPKIIKAMVNVKKLVNSSHVHANACAVLGTTLINRLRQSQVAILEAKVLASSTLLKVHMKEGRCQVGSYHCRILSRMLLITTNSGMTLMKTAVCVTADKHQCMITILQRWWVSGLLLETSYAHSSHLHASISIA